jgi:thioredoxin-dependent peroxiredoxin
MNELMAAKKRSKTKITQRTQAPAPKVAKPANKPGKVSAPRAVPSKAAAKAAPSKAAPPKAKAAPRAAKKGPVGKKAAAVPGVVKKPAAAKKAAKAAAPAKTAPAKAPTAPLGVGDRSPSFELLDQHGGSVSSSDLAGHPYVLYFYPKNDTPGCTTEACGFRDAFPEFERVGARVLGVSPDSIASHQKFVGKYGLPFTLLSDGKQELSSAYGVWALKKNYGREYMGIVRSTFLVDAEGIVRKVWRGVRVNGHVSEVQAAATQLA